MADTEPPVFKFEGSWPFSGDVSVGGHHVGAVTSWSVTAPADGLPVVTLTLLAPTALALALAQADVTVDDRTADALVKLGWTPPSDS